MGLVTRRATFIPVEDGTPDVDYASLGLGRPARVPFWVLLGEPGLVRGVAYAILFGSTFVAVVLTAVWVRGLS